MVPEAEAADLATGRSVDRVVDLAGGLSRPVRRRPRAPGPGRARADPLRPVRGRDRGRRTSPRSRPTPRAHPEAALDPRRRLGDGRLPRRQPDGSRPRRRRPRPAGVPAQPRPPRRLGEQPGARAGGHRRGHARPGRRPDRARPRRAPHRHAPRGGDVAWSRGTIPPTTDDELRARAAGRAGATSTRSASPAWQDAILGAYAGHGRPGLETYLRAVAVRRPHRDGRRRAVVGPRRRACEQVADLVERREALHPRTARAATSVKIMQDGVAENCTAALSTPYLDRCGHATAQPRPLLRRPAAVLREAVRGARRRGLPGARARDRGPRRARGAGRLRGTAGATDRSGSARGRATTSRTSRSCTPTTCRGSPTLGVAANMQALWACHDEQMVDLTLPFLGEERPRWQYPFGDLHRAGARLVAAATGRSARPDPLAAIHVAVNRTAYGDPGPRRRGPVPARAGARPREGVRGVHVGLGVGQPPRRRRRAGARARSPTWWCSTGTRSPGRRRRSARRAWSSTWVDGRSCRAAA